MTKEDKVRQLLAEGYTIWEASGLPTPTESERYTAADASLLAYSEENAEFLAAACQCFWLFRRLHEMSGQHPVYATLLGDWFFSAFSKSLIPLDSVELNDTFAELLAQDTQTSVSQEEYLRFVRRLPMVLVS